MIASLLRFIKPKNTYNKQKEIYNFGEDNDTPEKISLLVENSATARYCTGQMVQYLLGRGFGENDDILINDNQRLFDFVELCAKSKVVNGGIYIGVGWGFDGKKYFISDLKILPYENCRIGKQDDKDYSGKIFVYKDLNNKKDGVWYDVFNDNPKVIEMQINKAGSFAKYKGQILFISDDTTKVYPNSRINGSSELDLQNEIQIARYKNAILTNGFFGKTLILTKPLIDKYLKEYEVNENGESVYNVEYQRAKSEAENFKQTISNFMGAENVDGALHLQIDFENDDIDKQIKFMNIESKIDPNLFAQIEKITTENICKTFNNFPIGLLQHSSGGLNASGEQINELKKMYWENTERERNQLERVINLIWRKHENFNGQYLKAIPYEFVTNKINQ